MDKISDYKIPFSGYSGLDLINCFTGIYLYLENLSADDKYDCARNETDICNNCGNCKNSIDKIQEGYFFYFGTMSGLNSFRRAYTGIKNALFFPEYFLENITEFIFGFAGYTYKCITENIYDAITQSINDGIPVLARLKGSDEFELGDFRIIIGYDESNNLICPEPSHAQHKPNRNPNIDEIERIYLFGTKIEPIYNILDALKRISNILGKIGNEGIWDEYVQKFMYWNEKLQDAGFEEIKTRFNKICGAAWIHFNCHNFAETFRHRITDELKDHRLDGLCNLISCSYDDSHTRNWQIIALNDCRDWSKRRYNELEWGMCNSIIFCVNELKKNDDGVCNKINETIGNW